MDIRNTIGWSFPINCSGYLPHHLLLLNAFFLPYYPWHYQPPWHWLSHCLRSWTDRIPYQPRSGHHPFHVQRGGILCKFLVFIVTCVLIFLSMLVTRMEWSTPLLMTFIVIPTPTTLIKTGSTCQGHSTLTLPMYYSVPSQGQLVQLAVLTW